MRRKVLVTVVCGIILVSIVSIGVALLGGSSAPDIPTEPPVQVEQVIDVVVDEEPTFTPAPVETEAPVTDINVFVWEDIEGTDGKDYHPAGDISFYAEPRMDSEVMQTLTVDMVFQYNANVFINGEDSYFVRVELDGQQGYVVYPQLIAVEDEAEDEELTIDELNKINEETAELTGEEYIPIDATVDRTPVTTPKPKPNGAADVDWGNVQDTLDELGITFE